MNTTDSTALSSLSARALRDALHTSARWLERNRDALNAINVYPVPDGDTGTNMLLTFRAALEAGDRAHADSADGYATAFARGALLGARGNSGVILSQMFRGLAVALGGTEEVDGLTLREALTAAAKTAYEAVSAPVEGTMLTVMKDAAAAAVSRDDLVSVLRTAEEAAHASVARTPDLLPRLREAGVVDAGGQGVAVILSGLRMGVLGDPLPEAPEAPAGAVELAAVEHEGHGYCTEYLVGRRDGALLDRGALMAALEATGGESILVVGDPEALHVHLHLDDPGPALSVGVSFGLLQDIKIDNMQLQHEAWSASHQGVEGPRGRVPDLGLVAAASGAGVAAAFRELGALPLLDSAKPTTAAFLEAARAAGSGRVFLLPNHVDAIMAAEQAAREEPDLIRVIPTRSIPAGIAAAVAYAPQGDPDEVEAAMRLAVDGVRCVEVTFAARDVEIGGLTARKGQPIAFLDHVLVAAAATLEDALLTALESAVTSASEVVSIYLGADAPRTGAEELRQHLEAAFPELAVEVIDGGQPYYPYVAGVE